MADVSALVGQVRRYVETEMAALGGSPCVLAVSGGADSAAMVALLCDAGALDASRATVAHYDHRLRGSEAAERDREAVEALCERYGLRLACGAWAAPRRGEREAREARYAFLGEVACRQRAAAIVTGHTSDDQVETVLMHALRGAGLNGIGAMAPVARAPAGQGLTVMRPLLGVSRAETRAYCAARAIGFVDDATNEDRARLRNRVRLELLPDLERTQPEVRRTILRLAESARRSAAWLERVASTAIVSSAPDEVRLSRAGIVGLPATATPYAYRIAIARLLGDAREFDRRHYATMARIAQARTGALFELPRGVVAVVDAREVVLMLARAMDAAINAGVEHALPFDGSLGAWRVSVRQAGHRELEPALRGGRREVIALPPGAVMRGRRPGDRMRLRGMRGRKKLQDEYVDRKVPRRARDAAPVIASGSDVWWTPFGVGAESGAAGRWVVCWRRERSREGRRDDVDSLDLSCWLG